MDLGISVRFGEETNPQAIDRTDWQWLNENVEIGLKESVPTR